jgi:hypothetical protein
MLRNYYYIDRNTIHMLKLLYKNLLKLKDVMS